MRASSFYCKLHSLKVSVNCVNKNNFLRSNVIQSFKLREKIPIKKKKKKRRIFMRNFILSFQSTKMENNERLNTEHHHTYLNKSHNNSTFRRYNFTLNLNFVLLVLLTTLIPISLASFTCNHHEYWDSKLNECVPCTRCNSQQIVARPCQRHADAICQSINSIEIDWSKSFATERSRKVC